MTTREEVIAARTAYDRKCSLEGELRDQIGAVTAHIRETAASNSSAAAQGFTQAKKLVDACVVAGRAAGLSETDVRALLKRSDDFLRAHTTERNKFELAREAFWSFTPKLDDGARRRDGSGRFRLHHEIPFGDFQARP